MTRWLCWVGLHRWALWFDRDVPPGSGSGVMA